MTADIRRRLETRLSTEPVRRLRPAFGDHDLNPDWQLDAKRQETAKLRDAAVLVPLIDRDDGFHLLLTRRSADLPSHAGQVSFPGGRVQEGDASIADTALRETEEEVGLSRSFIDVMGYMEPYETGTGFAIQPVVAIVRPGFVLRADPREVAEIFDVPFNFVMDPANHQRHHAVWQGRERAYYAMPYGRHYIWGATAGMLVALHRRLFSE
jgi:8-oxo-dGTP pyrophosphatase MutT (NUDIX family)